jgi:endonuclease YncB( thermonuclease family)
VFTTQTINEKRRPSIALLAIAAALICGQPRAAAEENACAPALREDISVESVNIHLELRLTDGRNLLLRGIEAPRGTPSNPELPAQAQAFLTREIASQTLQADIDAGAPDRWGRRVAKVAVAGRAEPIVNEILRNGLARVHPLDVARDCLAEMLKLEAGAREGRVGLWADPAYEIVAAKGAKSRADRAGSVVLAEGQVISVGQWRTLTFLNLGADRQNDLSVSLSRRVSQDLERTGRSPASLKGATIRVRGLFQVRNSPRIEIFSAGSLEVLSAASGPGGQKRGTLRR